MNLGIWHSNKSLLMQEIRVALKKKAEKGQPSLSRKEANRTWREEILGILSEDQKRQRKTERQQKNKSSKRLSEDFDE
jgi:hypothetical protein